MEILKFTIDKFYVLSFSVNWLALIVLLILIISLSLLINKCIGKVNEKNIDIDEIKLGIGQSSVTVKYNRKDREIAYKLWVELNTRSIGVEFDEANDVITEIYDSWYKCFGITRELLKEIPENRIKSSLPLIELIVDILNKGIRPHLTRFQADFRRWYSLESTKQPNISPQKLQRMYQDYEELIKDLKSTNEHMIEYKNLLKKIAFDN